MKNKGCECEQFGISGIPGGFIEQLYVLIAQLINLFNSMLQSSSADQLWKYSILRTNQSVGVCENWISFLIQKNTQKIETSFNINNF